MGKIRKISATGSEPVKTALTVQKTVGATSITVNSIEGWHTGTGSDDEVPFVIYAVKPTGEIVAGSQSSWMGVVSRSSSTINNLRLTGGQDQIYPVGSKVVATSTAAWANELAEALLVSHNSDGSLKTQDVPNNSIDGAKLKDGTVDGAKLKDGSIEPGKLKGDIFKVETGAPTLTPYTWINGKPIYQIYASFNTAARSDNWEQVADLPNMPSDIESIVSVDGGLMISESDFWPIGYRNRIAPTNQDFEVKISKVSGKWQARYFTGGAGAANLVIRYTKK